VSFEQLCAVLVKEPYNLTLAQIGQLTPYQVRNIYFRSPERDQPKPARVQTYREIFWGIWKHRGLTEEQIAERWQRRQQERQQTKGKRRGR
jgi:hypothetical protein